MPSVFIKTYGCQMNVRDSEQVTRDLAGRGYDIAVNEEGADVVLLNTCSVRDMAEQKAIGKMETLGGRKNKRQHQIIGFLGCMAQSRGASILDELPDVDLVIGTQKFHETGQYIDDLFRQKREIPGREGRRALSMSRRRPARRIPFAIICWRRTRSARSSRSCKGCNMHCTFCIVPSTRGAERSRPIAEIVGGGQIARCAGREGSHAARTDR